MDIYGAIKLAQNRDAWRVFVNIANSLKDNIDNSHLGYIIYLC